MITVCEGRVLESSLVPLEQPLARTRDRNTKVAPQIKQSLALDLTSGRIPGKAGGLRTALAFQQTIDAVAFYILLPRAIGTHDRKAQARHGPPAISSIALAFSEHSARQ